MNETLRRYANKWILENVQQLPQKQQDLFRRCCNEKGRDQSMQEAINDLPDDRIQSSIALINRSLDKAGLAAID